ncbi:MULTISPECIES: hypothetical protein [unclassified Chryseobacterium]|uniref:hypothetical protein n=1 Tax=unclassified Chryseobacterium TaxID=2593645 RepID=UPI000AC8FF75|nr:MULTISPECIES: hypothetical protein [unclassified Chryseobacterium]
MKVHLIIFAVLIAGFVVYNFFFVLPDERMHILFNIVYASVLFGYISFVAFTVLKKLRK